MRPEEMTPEQWQTWIEYFTDPFEVKFWQERGWFIGLVMKDEVEEELYDFLMTEKGWKPDQIPKYVISEVVKRIYELVAE